MGSLEIVQKCTFTEAAEGQQKGVGPRPIATTGVVGEASRATRREYARLVCEECDKEWGCGHPCDRDVGYTGSLQVVLHAAYRPIVAAFSHDFKLSIVPSQSRGLFLHSNLSRHSNVMCGCWSP